MTIATFDQYIASPKQSVNITKVGTIVSIAFANTDVIAATGNPGAGVLAGTSTTAGVVPTSATAGAPRIVDTLNTLYLTRASFTSTVASSIRLHDLLYKAGPYAPGATTTVTAPPSFVSRIPLINGVPNYNSTQLWVEVVTAYTGLLSINVTYTNQSGVAGRATGVIATGLGANIARMLQLPLQSGDTGVQSIQSVVTSVGTVGTCNILILRPLWQGRIGVINNVISDNLTDTGMPEVYPTSCLFPIITPDSTSTGSFSLTCEIAG
jgi:hypothetical protein